MASWKLSRVEDVDVKKRLFARRMPIQKSISKYYGLSSKNKHGQSIVL